MYTPNFATNEAISLLVRANKINGCNKIFLLDSHLDELNTVYIDVFLANVDKQIEQINKDGYTIEVALPKKDKLIFMVKAFGEQDAGLNLRTNLAKCNGLCETTLKIAKNPKISEKCKEAIIHTLGKKTFYDLVDATYQLISEWDGFEAQDEAVLKALLEEGYDKISFE